MLKTRVAKNGEVPVVMRVTVNDQRVVASVNLAVDPGKWNAAAERTIANTRKDGERITAQGVMDRYLGRDAPTVVMLLDLFIAPVLGLIHIEKSMVRSAPPDDTHFAWLPAGLFHNDYPH
ncbi:MAG: hypothetical protein LBU98_00010 [Alistipes sp.]|nr:hypothetical protein [Alistipes sp.]